MTFDQYDRAKNEILKFQQVGSNLTAVRVNDSTVSTNKLAISAESVAFSAGAAGTTGVVTLDKAPIYNADGGLLGSYGDTSFAWVTGTVLTTEVAYTYTSTDAVQLAAMSNGEYAIDYDMGRIRYKKATTGTSDTCNYTSRQMNIELTGGTPTLSVGSIKIEDALTSTDRVSVSDANTARAVTTHVLAVQGVGADGTVAPTGSLLTNAPFNKLTDGTSNLTLGTGTTKTLPCELNDGTTKIVFGTGTTKNVPVGFNDGTTAITFNTGTKKTVPVGLSDGTTDVVVETDGTKKALNVNITDGTNDMPTADANSRALWTKLTDGTSDLTLGTGTVKTIPSQIHDGTTGAMVLAGTFDALYTALTDGGSVATMVTQDSAFGTAAVGLPLFGKYQVTPTTYTDGDAVPILLDENGRIVLSSDIEIGGVELKDGTTDNRAEIKAPNTEAFGFGLKTMPARYLASPGDLTDTYSTPILTDIKGRVQVTAAADIPTTLTGGTKTVAVPGTAEALGASLATKSIYIRAKSTNTSFVCVGDSSVDESTNQQIVLYANDSVTLQIANRATVYVDADVGAEGVDYVCSG